MPTKYIIETFADIINAVREEIGADSSDSKITNRIKRDINAVYLQEIVPAENWIWLREHSEIQQPAMLSTGTASVTVSSVTVTLTEAFAFSLKGWKFSTTGYNEIYTIAQHTAGSTTITLESPFTGTTSATANFRIWRPSIPLPANCRETFEITHDFRSSPLEGTGLQKFREIVAANPKAEGRPTHYTTGHIVDPDKYVAITGLPTTSTRASSGLVKTIKFSATLGADEDTALLRPGDRVEISSAGHYTYNGEVVVSSLSTTDNTNDTITYTVEETKSEAATADTGITIKKLDDEILEPGLERY